MNFMLTVGTVLLVLKVLDIITFSWWLVLLPFYLPFLIMGLMVTIGVIASFFKGV